MNFPFFKTGAKKRDQILCIDLGSRTTKSVLLQRKGDGFSLARYSILDAPIYGKGLSSGLLAEHLRTIVQTMDFKGKPLVLAIGAADSILRTAEFPALPISEMRQLLKYNSKNYFQQDLSNYVFDCYAMAPKIAKPDSGKPASPKFKVWVGGAKSQLLTEIQAAVKSAGTTVEQITLGLIGPANAFERAQPEVFAKEVVALLDLGFKSSSISILSEGELLLSRVIDIGGDKLTTGLSEAMNISYAEAEGIKLGMPTEVEPQLLTLLTPLGREVRASIDFFEHQHDRPVGQVLVSGGAAHSDFFIQSLQSEVMISCKAWNPIAGVQLALSPEQTVEIEQVASQLTVAIGAAAVAF